MYCKNCGSTVTSDAKFCQHCGVRLDSTVNWTYGGVQGNAPEPVKKDKPITASYGVLCPKCSGQSIRYNTVSESKPLGFFSFVLYVFFSSIFVAAEIVMPLAVIIFGIIILLFRKNTKTVTYATCQECGHRWRK